MSEIAPEDPTELDPKAYYYDLAGADLCQLSVGNGTVCFHTPDSGDIYYEIPVDEWPDASVDIRKVPEEAVENPVRYLNQWIDQQWQRIEEFDVGFLYARDMTDISEK